MANKFYKERSLSVYAQAGMLRRDFPQSKVVKLSRGMLVWQCDLTPTAISDTYSIEIRYSDSMQKPEVYVINPTPLPLFEGAKELPHVYDHKKQRICVHLLDEWNKTMPISNTFVPWASRWLNSYETWVVTGKWIGKSYHDGKFTY